MQGHGASISEEEIDDVLIVLLVTVGEHVRNTEVSRQAGPRIRPAARRTQNALLCLIERFECWDQRHCRADTPQLQRSRACWRTAEQTWSEMCNDNKHVRSIANADSERTTQRESVELILCGLSR